MLIRGWSVEPSLAWSAACISFKMHRLPREAAGQVAAACEVASLSSNILLGGSSSSGGVWHLGVKTNPYKWWSSERETNYSPLRSVSWTLVAFLYEPLFSVHGGAAVAPSPGFFLPSSSEGLLQGWRMFTRHLCS